MTTAGGIFPYNSLKTLLFNTEATIASPNDLVNLLSSAGVNITMP